jgi:hypothetical protein
MFELANKGTRVATKRMKLLRMEAKRLREETTAIGVAFQKMKDIAMRALQQLIQQILVAIGKAIILKVLTALPGAGGASSIVGAIGGFLGGLFGGGGGGGRRVPSGPPVAARGGGEVRIVPEALPNGDLGFAVRENERRRVRLGLEVG